MWSGFMCMGALLHVACLGVVCVQVFEWVCQVHFVYVQVAFWGMTRGCVHAFLVLWMAWKFPCTSHEVSLLTSFHFFSFFLRTREPRESERRRTWVFPVRVRESVRGGDLGCALHSWKEDVLQTSFHYRRPIPIMVVPREGTFHVHSGQDHFFLYMHVDFCTWSLHACTDLVSPCAVDCCRGSCSVPCEGGECRPRFVHVRARGKVSFWVFHVLGSRFFPYMHKFSIDLWLLALDGCCVAHACLVGGGRAAVSSSGIGGCRHWFLGACGFLCASFKVHVPWIPSLCLNLVK